MTVAWLTLPPSLEEELKKIGDEKHKLPTSVDCTPRHPYILFFNRIPKSGSTTLQEFFRSLSAHVDMETDIFIEGAAQWTDEMKNEVEDRSKALLRRAKILHGGKGMESYSPRGIYIQHFYYAEFPGLSLLGMRYEYITMVREPVERAISAYYYYHFMKKFKMPEAQRKAPLSECFQNGYFGCEANLMTQYFCGHSDICVSKNEQHKLALKTAKQNMLAYVAVGITEEFLISVQLFQRLLPDIIPQFVELPQSIGKKNVNEMDYMGTVSEADTNIVKEKNYLDVQLYAFAKDLFKVKLKNCRIS